MLLRSLSIGTRLIIGFAVLGIIILAQGTLGLRQVTLVAQNTEVIVHTKMPELAHIGQINLNMMRYRIFATRMAYEAKNIPQVEANHAAIQRILVDLKTAQDALRSAQLSDEVRAQFSVFAEVEAKYLAVSEEVYRDALAGVEIDGPWVVENVLGPLGNDIVAQLARLDQLMVADAHVTASEGERLVEHTRLMVIGSIVAALALIIVAAGLIARSIVLPLRGVVETARVIASGDLTQPVVVTGQDEVTHLTRAMLQMQAELRDTLARISAASNELTSASEELSVAAAESTNLLVSQNDEVQQAASAVTEMSAAVDEVARNASATAEASNDAARLAHEGRDQVRETVRALRGMTDGFTATALDVERLSGQSRDIGKVLDVIRAIAEQTNLLALNAAIEAARAGEAGRGFAVVADEVRALAHRTQVSTQEIEQMIESVQNGTDRVVHSMHESVVQATGALQVAEVAGESLEGIYQRAGVISERNLVIASASEEQAAVAREVDRNIVNISNLSIQTAAGAKQSSGASNELSRLAVELNNAVMRFRV